MSSLPTLALADLLDLFASNEPAPGGGSASALAGALGASLLLMVAGMPKTKSGTPEEAADLAEASARIRPLRDDLMSLIDRDTEAYTALMGAFRLPRTSDEEKATRKLAIEAGTQLATQVPLETMQACGAALRDAVPVAANGNRNAASDVLVAIELLLAGLRGAAANVEINLGGIGERGFAERARRLREELEADATAHAARARELLQVA